MVTTIVLFALLLAAGFAQVKIQQRSQKQMAALSPDVRKRFKTIFPLMMGFVLLAFFVFLYFARSHA